GAVGRCAGRQRTAAARANRPLFIIRHAEGSSQGDVPAVGDRVSVSNDLADGAVCCGVCALGERQNFVLTGGYRERSLVRGQTIAGSGRFVGDRAGVDVRLGDRVRGGAAGRCAGRQRTAAARADRPLFIIRHTERSSQRGVPVIRNRISVRNNLSHGVVGRRVRALGQRQACGLREIHGGGIGPL